VLAKRPGAERPGILPHREPRGSSAQPHRHAAYPQAISLGKAVYYTVDFSLGWLMKIVPFVRRGGCVIIERGWLSGAELDRQMDAWNEVLPTGQRRVCLDTSRPLDKVAQDALRAITGKPAIAVTGVTGGARSGGTGSVSQPAHVSD